MGVSWTIFLIVIAWSTFSGYRRGLALSLSRIIGLSAGYVAVLLYAQPVAAWVGENSALQGMIAYGLACAVLFVGTDLVVSLLSSLCVRTFFADKPRRRSSAFGGAGIGLLAGCVLGLILVWSVTLLRELIPENKKEMPLVAWLAQEQPSAIESVAKKLAGVVVGGAMDAMQSTPELTQASKALAQAPDKAVKSLKRVSQKRDVQKLLNDRAVQQALQQSDPQALAGTDAFMRLRRDPDVQTLLQLSGLADQSDEELAQKFNDVWLRAQRVKDNPQFQQIIKDPEFQDLVNSGNPMALLMNPKVQTLASIIFSNKPDGEHQQP